MYCGYIAEFSSNKIKFKFYFMTTANIPVYGNIAVYIQDCAVEMSID